MTAPMNDRSTLGGGSGWEGLVKWLGIPIIALAVAWGGLQVTVKTMATREEVTAIRAAQERQSAQMSTLINQVSRLTCKLYPQSIECPDKALDGFNHGDVISNSPSVRSPR